MLKRALSDSFASVALNIENLSAQPETRMKDIKLSASSESRRGSTQRSWSLAEHVGDERLALQLAKEMVEREIPEEQVLPMPDIVPLVPVSIEEEKSVPAEPDESVKKKKKTSRNNNKVSCPLVSIVRLEQRLAEVELELQVPVPICRTNRPSPARINSTRCPGGCLKPLRTQESVAWEYHQNPSCSFNIRLAVVPHPPHTLTTTTNQSPIGAAKVRRSAHRHPPRENPCMRIVPCVSFEKKKLIDSKFYAF